MRRSCQVGIVLFLMLAPPEYVASARQTGEVVVKAGLDVYGYGVIRWRGAECNVITPEHVIKGRTKIMVAIGNETSPASVVATWYPDIALLNVKHASICPVNVNTLHAGVVELRNKGLPAEAKLHLANVGGATDIVRVQLLQIDSFDRFAYILSDDSSVPLRQQMSGGQVYVDGMPIGLILGIEEVGERAKVVLHEHLSYLLRPYLKRVEPKVPITVCLAQHTDLEDITLMAFLELRKRTRVPSFTWALTDRDFRLITTAYVEPFSIEGPVYNEDDGCWDYTVVYRFFADNEKE